ncbi:MAG: CdaR family protein [Spirochaetota bacterium]
MKFDMKRFAEFSKRTNLVAKLVSIILAIILWAYITNTHSGDIKFNIPVDFKNIDDSFIVSRVSQRTATVRLSGRKDDLRNVRARDIQLFVNLGKAKIGEYSGYNIELTRNDVPDKININIQPDEIRALVERKISKDVKIIPKFSGNPEKGFHAGKVKLFPETVTLTGAPSRLNEIESVFTRDISLEGIRDDIQKKIDIQKFEQEGIEYSTENVNVTIPVISYADVAQQEVPILVKNGKKGYIYTLEKENVHIHFVPEKKKKALDYKLAAFIDMANFGEKYSELETQDKIEWLADVHIEGDRPDIRERIISITPDKVLIVITKE